jgi:hypothetical protein
VCANSLTVKTQPDSPGRSAKSTRSIGPGRRPKTWSFGSTRTRPAAILLPAHDGPVVKPDGTTEVTSLYKLMAGIFLLLDFRIPETC